MFFSALIVNKKKYNMPSVLWIINNFLLYDVDWSTDYGPHYIMQHYYLLLMQLWLFKKVINALY